MGENWTCVSIMRAFHLKWTAFLICVININQQKMLNKCILKGIVHFEIKIWYLSAYPKGIQDVGVFFSRVEYHPRVDSSETTRAMTVRVFQQENTTKLRQHHASDTPSVKREPERAHTHVTHRMCVRTQITWTWLCTRGKKRYKYCSFSHTNRSFRVLGHQCVVTMGNCLILISLMYVLFPSYRDSDLYLPLYDWQTRTVWPKNIKIGSTEEKKTPTSWMPLG